LQRCAQPAPLAAARGVRLYLIGKWQRLLAAL
jgi:hypothetical protein